ncbi:DUF4190 domain-containing protein [Micromonospora sp. NPDC006766]|uniref:DUF4190 domain-containing protein n=1 Tax=Micromonospora sp. NPDC006766 TaxID=3154778 RepID=UPI0033E9118E
MKILSRRNGPARSQDVNGDGIVDDRDRDPVAVAEADGDPRTPDRMAEPRTADRADVRRRAAARAAPGQPLGTEPRSDRATADPGPRPGRTVDMDRDDRLDRPLDRDDRPDRPLDRADLDGRVVPAALGPKPRASLLATVGLIVSVVGALFVLTGTLAGYGIGLGAVGAVLAVLGLIATRRRHVAGKTDALIGIVVGLAAVVLGVVAMTGQFDWPTTGGEWVGRFREWLDSQFAGLF